MKQHLAFLLLFTASLLPVETTFAEQPRASGKLDIKAAIAALPEKSDKPFVENRLLDNGGVGIRVFRIYNPVPRHHHDYSSTYLNIVSGRVLFSIEGGEPFEAGAGDMVFWERGVDHQVVRILEHPLTAIAIDAPTRREGDVQLYIKSD